VDFDEDEEAQMPRKNQLMAANPLIMRGIVLGKPGWAPLEDAQMLSRRWSYLEILSLTANSV
jgi:hypothetical protein